MDVRTYIVKVYDEEDTVVKARAFEITETGDLVFHGDGTNWASTRRTAAFGGGVWKSVLEKTDV